ncbi:Glucosamine-6-phosphate isomerases/6-phosphogluconolactonase, partial [Candidatus Electrothrix communis]
MGNDGHTASLFPGSAQLAAATDMNSGKICMAVTPADAPHERMTLTLPAILGSQEIILHIAGQEKKVVLAKAQEAGPAE